MTAKKAPAVKKKAAASPEKATDEKEPKKVKKAPSTAAAKPKKKTVSKRDEEEEEEESSLPRPIVTPPKPIVTAPVVTPPPAKPAPVVAPKVEPAPAAPVAAKPAAPEAPKPAVAPAKPAPAPAAPVAKTPPPPAAPAKPGMPKPVSKQFPPAKPFAPKPPFQRPAPPTARPSHRPAERRPMPALAEKASAPVDQGKKKIRYNEMMSVKDIAAAMNVKVPDVIKKLLTLGTPASINQRLSAETAALLATAFEFEIEVKSIYSEEKAEAPEDKAKLKPRPPVVTVMGHVDHGKTSLLDAIRSTSVVKGEAGGITQHIGAYQVILPNKGVITFLDTPGHEAFTAMRARGAMATDIVILVVAADDSVMPQTIEAIDHAKAAGVPIVVAINKVDLPTANVQKVKQELAQHNLVAEDWGGKTVMVEVSAKTKQNIDKLLEMLLLEAELLELKANPDRPAKGVVLEAHMDPKRGIMATIMIQAGTLKIGDVAVCGLSSGRVRAMLDDHWNNVESAGPSFPVRLLGLAQVPQVGDQLSVVANEREAREIAERRKQFLKDSSVAKPTQVSLESLHAAIVEGKIQDLPIILKADVQGSLQAIQDSLGKITDAAIQLRLVHVAVGNINESDVLLAEASNAIVFGFNVKMEAKAEAESKKAGVDVRTYAIIYEILADIRAAMEGLLKPEEKEVVKGRAQVKSVFASSRFGMVAGVMITEGKVVRGNKARVLRGGQEVAVGAISSLKRFKDDVKEVEKGYECGLSVEGFKSFAAGDSVEVFVIEKVARRLDA